MLSQFVRPLRRMFTASLEQTRRFTGSTPKEAFVDRGHPGHGMNLNPDTFAIITGIHNPANLIPDVTCNILQLSGYLILPSNSNIEGG